MNISLRKATKEDNAAICALLQSQQLPVETIGTGRTDFFLAEENDVLVGVAGFEYYGVDALLRSVALPSNFQKRGIGSLIVDFMVTLAQQRGIRKIILLTTTAAHFFERKGFRIIDRAEIDNLEILHSSEFTHACPSSAVCEILDLTQDSLGRKE